MDQRRGNPGSNPPGSCDGVRMNSLTISTAPKTYGSSN